MIRGFQNVLTYYDQCVDPLLVAYFHDSLINISMLDVLKCLVISLLLMYYMIHNDAT